MKAVERLCAAGDDPRSAPKTLMVVAHPDDETVGAGARLSRLKGVRIVHVTDGSPRNLRDALAAGCRSREEYAAARRNELRAALELAGIDPSQTIGFDVPDQEASAHLPELIERVIDMLREFQPDIILTHPYEGGHPDHDAVALAVHAARRSLVQRGLVPPAVVEMASYHAAGGRFAFSEFLPGSDSTSLTCELSASEQSLKRRLLACYRTQQSTLAQFRLDVERFRPAPIYDFTRPPHPGRLFYEHFDWGMTGHQWRELAAGALRSRRIPLACR